MRRLTVGRNRARNLEGMATMLRLAFVLALILGTTTLDGELWGQYRTPARNLVRRTGLGWSAGYQVRNPGHDVGYYNPWSAHNLPRYVVPGESSLGLTYAEPHSMPIPNANFNAAPVPDSYLTVPDSEPARLEDTPGPPASNALDEPALDVLPELEPLELPEPESRRETPENPFPQDDGSLDGDVTSAMRALRQPLVADLRMDVSGQASRWGTVRESAPSRDMPRQ